MPHVILSERARSDIARLHAFLLEKDASAARRALLAIREALVPLKQSPLIGRPTEDRPGFRELVIDFGTSGYLALYCHEPPLDIVTILAIKHQKEHDYK
ncbi:MAG: type II toxin-antitoxin system RelE/ParE family toxin [Sideroxydans sp.]|nr:type II toxin-antitoxin system RelE/ParE family toxin [Sideroxydans sp.]